MNKIVIYTAIFGGKDNLLEPTVIPPGCDFVCFSDRNLTSKTWQMRVVEPPHADPMRAAKIYKILPHTFFPEYEYSIWVDANVLVRGDVVQLIERYLTKANIAFFDHDNLKADRCSSVYVEGEFLIMRAEKGKAKDDPELIRAQMNQYKKDGFPDTNGLIVGTEIVRRHTAPDVKKTMEDWWKEIETYSRRDQLSFNYVAWKNNLHFIYMDGDAWNNEYFFRKPHVT